MGIENQEWHIFFVQEGQDKVQDKPTSLKTILNFSESFPAKKVIQ